jgi:arginine decarboxylase-like protein
MNSLITAESGRRILGKLRVLSNPVFEVIALAPAEKEPEKKENRNTPVIRNGIKFAGLKSPRIKPKTKP